MGSNFFNIMISTPLNSVVTDWAQRVQRNGGATPSLQTLTAMDRFFNGLVYTNLSSSMKTLNVFAPDSLIACQTPLFIGSAFNGLDPWRNTNFVSSDLSVNGLQGNSPPTKYLTTGVTASLAFPTGTEGTGSAGMTLYVTSASNGNENDMGVWVTPVPVFGAYVGYAGTAYFDCWTSVGGGRCSAANSLWRGFITFNRTAVSSSRIDKASSTVQYQTIATATTGYPTTTAPVFPIGVFRQLNSTTGCTKRFSFAAVHSGLSSGSAVTFYNLIQQLRKDMGGGWI